MTKQQSLVFHILIPVLAELALERLGAGVDPDVLTKTLSVGEPLPAMYALEIPLSSKFTKLIQTFLSWISSFGS